MTVFLSKILRLPLRILRVFYALIEWSIFNYPQGDVGTRLRRRFVEKKFRRIGRNFRLMNGCRFIGMGMIEIGNDSGIADRCTISLGPGDHSLKIGDDSFIGPETYIRNANHRFDRLDVPIMKQGHESKDVIIGNGVWVGARCILLPGTRLGDHCIIAAGSVVSFEIPPFSIAAGNPARVIKKRIPHE